MVMISTDPTEVSALNAIGAMLEPASIAVIGATERPGYGSRMMTTLQRSGYRGQLYPVNPNRPTVHGLPCYPTPLDLPGPPDLAVVIVPAAQVLESVRQCAQAGARSAVIISAGFGELGSDLGRGRQRELHDLVAETGLRLVGPNCLGLANLARGIFPTASSRVDAPPGEPPSIALISQSGASGFGPLLTAARDRGSGYRYIVTTGNEVDLGLPDFLAYFVERDDVRVIVMLVEGFRDFARFRRLAEQARADDRTLVVLKVGRSEAGRRAAQSHTAALTGDDRAIDAIFRQLSVVRVQDYDELVEQSAMFAKVRRPVGRRFGVLSHSGGIGTHLSDQLGVQGLEVPAFAEATRQVLAGVLGERGSANNPADTTGFTFGPALKPMLGAILTDPSVDACLIGTGGTDDLTRTILEAAASTDKPVAVVWTGSQSSPEGLAALQASSVPVFGLPSGAARGLAALVRRSLAGRGRTEAVDPADREPLTLPTGTLAGALSERASRQLLAPLGLQGPPEVLCTSADAAVAAAAELGYPVVLKACAAGLAHKSDLGLVRLDLRTPDEVAGAYAELARDGATAVPGELEGVLVQRFVRGGVEALVGLTVDPQLGPLLALGLGGTLVEVLGAVTWRACPIGPREAEAMIDDLPALATLLGGVRGAPPADRAALAATLTRLSHLPERLGGRLETVDVNPLLVRPAGEGVVALDALVVLSG